MSNLQAFALGLMVAWTPSMIVIAILLWRAPIIEDEEDAPPKGVHGVDVAIQGPPPASAQTPAAPVTGG